MASPAGEREDSTFTSWERKGETEPRPLGALVEQEFRAGIPGHGGGGVGGPRGAGKGPEVGEGPRGAGAPRPGLRFRPLRGSSKARLRVQAGSAQDTDQAHPVFLMPRRKPSSVSHGFKVKN